MATLIHSVAYIDLGEGLDALFAAIQPRSQRKIKHAIKEGIKVVRCAELEPQVLAVCQKMLRNLMRSELVPYSRKFDALLGEKDNYFFLAFIDGEVASFLEIAPRTGNPFFAGRKTAYSTLAATEEKFKHHNPNYLLLWEAIRFLKQEGFQYLSLGLLRYLNAPDPGYEQVAFFKTRWGIKEFTETENCSLGKKIYVTYLKRFFLVRKMIYSLKLLTGMYY